jgi:formylglycine-generating enzyme required for sulfatase activity
LLGIGISLALIVIFGVGFLLAGMIRNMAANQTDLPLPVETKATLPLVTTTAPVVAQTAAPVSPTAASTPPTQTSPPAPSTVPQFIPVHLTDSKGVEMSLVQAGEFLMGSNEADPGAKKDEMPQKRIFLDDYYLDLTEVTNGMYRLCVDAGACQSPGEVKSSSHEAYYGNPEYDDFPVVYVDWEAARRYCEWRGARLPTEAEWEKAARGTDARTYPWGEGVDCNWANVEGCVADTVKVGSYKTKASPYGMQDMAGNVWEWVGDWYQDTSYQLMANENPTGPSSGKNRVMRGGSCSSTWENSRAANRSWRPPSDQNSFIGFRCARSP